MLFAVAVYLPLSLRDISPTRGEITFTLGGHLTLFAQSQRPISPLVGEMSRSDRGGYPNPETI